MQTSIAEDGEAAEVRRSAYDADYRREIHMSVSFKAPMIRAFTLAISLFALPALCAATHDRGHRPVQHRVVDFGEAGAYVSPVTPVAKAPETDGLSRNGEECSRGGCIDN
jgi:hypothetical protein